MVVVEGEWQPVWQQQPLEVVEGEQPPREWEQPLELVAVVEEEKQPRA